MKTEDDSALIIMIVFAVGLASLLLGSFLAHNTNTQVLEKYTTSPLCISHPPLKERCFIFSEVEK